MTIKFVFKDEIVEQDIEQDTLVQIKLLKGETGYTPVKGVDYFTQTDKEEIESEVINSIHIPTELSELNDDSTHRLVTDTEKTEWNNKAETSDIPDVSSFITKDVNNLTNYTLKTNTGSLIDLEINGTTYVVTLKLKDQDGNVISTGTIDLPLESVVVGGTFDSVNKKIVLTLENGNTVDIPVGDLISGLQTEITSQNKLESDLVDDTNSGNKFTNTSEKAIWNAKYDKPAGGIPNTDLANAVQTSLEKADTAIQEHQDISGKEDKTNKVTELSSSSTNTQYPGAKCVYDSQTEQDEEIETLQTKVNLLESLIPSGEATGESISINDSARYPFKEFNVGGNTKQATAILPDEYQQVDYIESSGTQYIDTGYVPRQGDSFELKNVTIQNNGPLLSAGDGESQFILLIYNTNEGYFKYFSNGNAVQFSEPYTINGNIRITNLGYLYYNNNYKANISAQGDVNTNLFLLKRANQETYLKAKLGEVIIKSNDTLVRDFIPCYRKSDNVVGLYDAVNKTFYTNAGTGAFTYGATVTIPNPNYPQEVQNLKGENINKFLVSTPIEKDADVSYEIVNNNSIDITYNGTSKTYRKVFIAINNLKPNTNYSFKANYTNSNSSVTRLWLVIRDENQYGVRLHNSRYLSDNVITFTTGSSSSIVVALYAVGEDSATENTAQWKNLQLVEGSFTSETIPVYSPYNYGSVVIKVANGTDTTAQGYEEQTAILHLPEGMEMCKIPNTDYKDTFVERDGKWYKKNVIDKEVLNGSKAWSRFTNKNNKPIFTCKTNAKNIMEVTQLCNYGIWAKSTYNYGNLYNFALMTNATFAIGTGTTETTVEEWKSKLAENNLICYYVLTEPVLEEITDTTLISDLNNLKNLYSYKGTTYISSSNNPSPIFDVKYKKDLEIYFNELIDENINQAIGGSY